VESQEFDNELAAHTWLKLLTLSLDAGDRDVARACYDHALAVVPSSRPGLRTRIAAVGLSEFRLRPPEQQDSEIAYAEPLTEFPWIVSLAHKGETSVLLDSATSLITGAWSYRLHFGRPLIEDLRAAERQATWAGAWWMVQDLRGTLAAAMVLEVSQPHISAPIAAALWILSMRSEIGEAIDYLEPHFADRDADTLWTSWLHFGRAIRSPFVRDDAVLASWDLLSPDVASEIMKNASGPALGQATRDTLRRAFVGLGVLSPENWDDIFSQLDDRTQEVVALDAAPVLIRKSPLRLSSALRSTIVRLARSWSEADGPRPEVRVVIELLRSVEGMTMVERLAYTDRLLQHAPARDVVLLAATDRSIVPTEVLEAAVRILAEETSNSFEAALGGSASFGGVAPWSAYLVGLGLLGQLDLVNLASVYTAIGDSRIPPGIRMMVMTDLLRLASEYDLPMQPPDVPEAAQGSVHLSLADLVMGVGESGSFVAMARLLRLGILGIQNNVDDILAAMRNGDARIRELAVGLLSGRWQPLGVDITSLLLLGALYDPEDSVVATAIDGWPSDVPIGSGAQIRLAELLDTGRRRVRVAIARMVDRRREFVSPDLRAAIGSDRSWYVRSSSTAES
jgi:hypothetical protein